MTISISIILASVCATSIAHAQAVPFFGEAENICELIKNIVYFGVGLAGVAAMLVIMIGGIIYMVSFGSEERKKTGMDLMGGAVKGLLLALFSWTIFYIISPYLLRCKVPVLEVELPEWYGERERGIAKRLPCQGKETFDRAECSTKCGVEPGEARPGMNCIPEKNSCGQEGDKYCCLDLKIDHITVHWTAGHPSHITNFCTNGYLGYHYVVDSQGTVHQMAKDWEIPPWHTKGRNTRGIGITAAGMAGAGTTCYVESGDIGGCPNCPNCLTQAQINAMKAKIAELANKYNIPSTTAGIITHGEAAIEDGYYPNRWEYTVKNKVNYGPEFRQ